MVDDYAQFLIGEQSNPNAILLEILGDDYESWRAVVAVEGPDDKVFYHDFIAAITSISDVGIFDCGGKDKLLTFKEAVESYQWRSRPKFFFLCDKDFDDVLDIAHAGVFKTNVYSIESFFCGPDFVEYVVQKYSTKPLGAKEKQDFIKNFSDRFLSALKVLRLVSAAMCEVRATGTHPNFDNFGLEKIFNLADGSMSRKTKMLENFRNECKLNDLPEVSDICLRAKSFSVGEYRNWLRGKLGLQVTRKIYEICRLSSPEDLRGKLPQSNHFGGEALKISKLFLNEVPGLSDYMLGA